MCRSSLQDLSGGVSRFPRGPVARNHRPRFFDPNEVEMIAIVDRIEKYVFFDPIGRLGRICDRVESIKCGRQFPVAGCLEMKLETPPEKSWREVGYILR